jgi:cytochrome c-type biogenesis protein CcmF
MPLAILAAMLTVLGQYLFWKRHNAESLANELLWPVAGACIATLTTIFIGDVRDLYYMLYLLSAWFALFGNGFVMVRLARKKPKLIGGSLSHIGFGIMLLGFLASSAYDGNLLDLSAKQYNEAVRQGKVTDKDGTPVRQPVNFLELKLNEPKVVNDKYLATYQGYSLRNQDRAGQQEYKIKFEEIEEDGSGDTFYLYPQVYPMSSADQIQWSVDVDVKAGLLSDVYLYVAGSSYVERKNKEYKKMKESQSETVVQPASQNMDEAKQDSVPTQKIILAKEDSVWMGDYRFTFKKYNPVDQSQLPDSTSIAVQALVDVQYKANDEPFRLNPLFVLYSDEGKNWVYSPPQTLPEHDIEVQFTSINPETGKIELTIKGISEKPREEWILLTAEEKPFVSLVWLGTFVLMAGFSVSILRHWDRERKRHR